MKMRVRAFYMMPLYKIEKDTPDASLHSLAGFLPGTLVQCTTHTIVPFGPRFRRVSAWRLFPKQVTPAFQTTQARCENSLKQNAKCVCMWVHRHTLSEDNTELFFFSPNSPRVQSLWSLDLNLGPGSGIKSGRGVSLEPGKGLECVQKHKHLLFHFSKIWT